MKKEKIIYYSDLLHNDFSGTNITVQPLPDSFKYVHKNIFWRLWTLFLYYLIAKPLILIIVKIMYHQKFVNKKVIKQARKTGAFLYGNHTTKLADAFVPNILITFRRNYIISSPETMSIPCIKDLLSQLGVIPLSDKLVLKKKFLRALRYRLDQNALITVYPEAHIWPFYTKIRPFENGSFKYPAMFNKPIYSITNCYQKRKFGKFPKIITFVDGPFYPKAELTTSENANYLRNIVYDAMVKRTSENSTYEYVKYIYRPKEDIEAFDEEAKTNAQEV